MLNVTLLSFTISSSFQRSPFLHFPTTITPSVSVFKSINVQQLFSSFLITQSINSFSIIKESTFNKFITSFPVLCFMTNEPETVICNQTFYGDSIPSSNNKFYHTNYTKIINCKFMSIIDNKKEQLLSDGGLCIYSSKETIVDSCYFFAILSRRSGSAILFETIDYLFYSEVVNSMFKSITQIPDDNEFACYTGGAISHGNVRFSDHTIHLTHAGLSKTDNCCFDKIRLIGDKIIGYQLGVVTYVSEAAYALNLNFTNNEMHGYSDQYGFISYCSLANIFNYIEFVNIFNCVYNQFGYFSVGLAAYEYNEIEIDFANFINNSQVDNIPGLQFGIIGIEKNESIIILDNIQCNSKDSFFLVSAIKQGVYSIGIIVTNSIFGCSFSTFMNDVFDLISMDDFENNIFDFSDFNIDVTNNIIDNFGYVQTSQFSASNMFFEKTIQKSYSSIDLDYKAPRSIEVFFYILAVTSIIVFIVIVFYRGMKKIIDFDQFTQINFDYEIDDISINQSEKNNMNKETSIETPI